MAETCAVLGTGLTQRNRNYGKQAMELLNGLQKEGYLSSNDVSLATSLLSRCDTNINRQIHDNLKSIIELVNKTPITGIFPSEEAKKAAFQAEFKKTIADPDGNPKTNDSVDEHVTKGNFNTGLEKLLQAVHSAADVACGKKEYTPPKALTPKQVEDSKVLPGTNPQTKEGVLADLIRQTTGKPIDEQIKVWKEAAEKAEAKFGTLKNPSAEAKDEHEEAARLLKLADALFKNDNKNFALENYKQSLSAQPASVFPLK